MERTVRTPDGRTLAVEDAGDSTGRPVLVHMGTPNSRHLYGPHVADAALRGLRLISYDRPGFGGSTPHPGRTVADTAADVRSICEALDIDRLAMWGQSGGGPYVLACAALLPDLITAAALLASPAPYGAEGLDWFAGNQTSPDDHRLLLTDEKAARAEVEKQREAILAASASDLAEVVKPILTPTDAAVFTGGLAEYFAYFFHEGLAPGSQGYWDEILANQVRPWGFELTDIRVPVLLMHGRQDGFVPFTHGQWLAAHVPGVEARLLDNDGHLTLLEHRVAEVHAWLSDRL